MSKTTTKLTVPKKKQSLIKIGAWLFLIGLLLSFEFVATPLGNAVGVDGAEIAEWAKFCLKVLSGIGMIWIGIAALSLPVLGYALILGGLVILFFQIKKFF